MDQNTDTPINTNNFIASFSTCKDIYLKDELGEISLNINFVNPICQYERVEIIESIDDIFPNGSLIVRDTSDIITYIQGNNITKIVFTFLDGSFLDVYITSTTYINNAASNNDENYVAINFSNKLYKQMQSTALLDLLKYRAPIVYRISDFINVVASSLNTSVFRIDDGGNTMSNYIVYKPFSTTPWRTEHPLDSALQYINYITSFACSAKSKKPRFMFWTNIYNQFVFKYFEEDIEQDPYATDSYLTENKLRYKIYDGNDPSIMKIKTHGEGETQTEEKLEYKKINYMITDPADQFISKNYYYIRKTPKILSKPIEPVLYSYTPDIMEKLIYQYQDEGEKFDVELISSNKTNNLVPGAEEIVYDKEWGYYDGKLTSTDNGLLNLIGRDFGSAKNYSKLKINGNTGYFQYVDTIEMWKMMFDFTEIHPNYPDTNNFDDYSVLGIDTNLQKVLDIRYQSYKQNLIDQKARLETFRKIERENFIMYVLCCMSKDENCFFARLKKFELDQTFGAGLTGSPGLDLIGGISGATFIPYRYQWVKLNFNSTYGDTGPINYSGTGGTAYFCHNVEAWEEDLFVKSGATQDNTWAINLNERSIGRSYLPPGWDYYDLPKGFYWRPIGANSFPNSDGYISHIVKMCAVPVSDLLLDSKQQVGSNYMGQYVYYFTAENVVDGRCTTTTPQ